MSKYRFVKEILEGGYMNQFEYTNLEMLNVNIKEQQPNAAIVVQRATLEDVEGIYTVAASVGKGRKESTKGFLMDDYSENPTHYKNKFKKNIETLQYIYTAKKEGAIVGFLIAYTAEQWLDDNPNWLDDISWKPDFDTSKLRRFIVIDKTAIIDGMTGQGVGSKLYRTLMKDLRKANIKHIFSETLIDPVPNFASLAFRKKQEYKLAGTRFENYKNTTYTDLIYYKTVVNENIN